jgi:hypothetical protein
MGEEEEEEEEAMPVRASFPKSPACEGNPVKSGGLGPGVNLDAKPKEESTQRESINRLSKQVTLPVRL